MWLNEYQVTTYLPDNQIASSRISPSRVIRAAEMNICPTSIVDQYIRNFEP